MSTTSRILSFVVEGQKLKKDEDCDFTNLISGTKNYYEVTFKFDSSWDGYNKVVVFRTKDVTKYMPLLSETCKIPEEITESPAYYVSVVGSLDDVSLPTNEEFIKQIRGGINGRQFIGCTR